MIDYEAEAAADAAVFEHFHSLTKYNSTKAERVAAWDEVEKIRWRRRARAMRMHPIAPACRWLDYNDSAPEGWTYPGLRTLEPDEVDEMFPGARAAFAWQCDDIKQSRFVFNEHQAKGGRLRLSVPMSPTFDTKHANVTWVPEMGIWRRYSRHVSAKPYERIVQP